LKILGWNEAQVVENPLKQAGDWGSNPRTTKKKKEKKRNKKKK
jgi:hypothetical protein